jgi:small subunit ribosomal protein S15e
MNQQQIVCACMQLSEQIEIKGEHVGHYLAEFSISYKPTKHGRPGVGSTTSSRFIPLK